VTGDGRTRDGAAARRPLVKICGVTRPEDALLAVELGADLLGLNFYPGSPRFLSRGRAAEIARAVAGRALVAGVFVDAAAREIEDTLAEVGLDLVQLHGDEDPAVAARFGPRALPVFRLDPGAGPERLSTSTPPVIRSEPAVAAYPAAWGFLVDVRDPAAWGGTGRAWDWSAAAPLVLAAAGRPVLVAGGVRPANAGAALRASGAAGIDVCSGVEAAPGVKDPHRLRLLFSVLHDAEGAA
jgi:phosphoribosylanthranilate isomerase